MDRHPTMVAHHMSVANDMTRALELAVVGADAEHLVKVQYARFRPHVAMAVATGTGSQVPLLADRTPSPDGSARAFVCRNFVCELPVTDPVSLAAQLDS